ncbi:MAG: AMP-binding protein [Deltaproteobacteria bacterium]|nr:AMP-binding protein [Deltaproteobacteria bacterium]
MKSIYLKKPWLKFYPDGVPSDIEVPLRSVNDAFNEATEKWKSKTAIIFYGKKISFQELREKVDRLATALFDLGVKKGDRVAFLMLNSPEFLIGFFAVLKLGAIVTPISPVYVSDEIKYQLENSGAEHIICLDILYDALEKTGIGLKNIILTNITDSLPKLKKILGKSILRGVYQKMAAPSPNIFSHKNIYQLKDLIRTYPADPPNTPIQPREDLAWLPYTGGTTGFPKGVMISHYNIVVNDMQFRTFLHHFSEGNEVLLGYMPFYHVAGFMAVAVNSIFHGFTNIILTSPDLDDILNSIVKYKVSMFAGAPAIFESLKDYDRTNLVAWNELKLIMSAADSLHESTAKDWKSKTGETIHEYYGQTELTCAVMGNPAGRGKIGSIGVPLPGTAGAILHLEKDEFIPMGEIGELAISGPQLAKGYWHNEEATRECEAIIDGVRWWRTGDLTKMDEDGYFFLYDRKKDLIKYKGLQVLAREVEEALKKHPKIKEVGVIGVPDIKVGQLVKAFVVVESDARGTLSEKDIVEYCQGKLSHYKIPKIIEFVGELPKTDIGKVSRRELREERG